MEEIFYLTSVEQMRGIADPIRIRILDRLVREPLTVTQLGAALGESPAKLHYHVRELEHLGLIKLVETREKGGILEKYYRAVAKDFQAPASLLHSTSPDDVELMLEEWFRYVVKEGTKAAGRALQTPGEPVAMGSSTVWATKEQFRELLKELETAVRRYSEPQHVPDEREWTVSLIAHSVDTAAVEHVPTTPPSEQPAAQTAQRSRSSDTSEEPSRSRRKRVFAGGVMEFKRSDLERAIASHERYDIQAIGIVRFADDVTPDLIEQAVARFKHRGTLHASPAVREALRQKGAQAAGRE